MTLRYESKYLTRDGSVHLLSWASGDDFATFETAIATDPTISSFELITEQTSKRLYDLHLAGDPDEFVYTYMLDHQIQYLDLEITMTQLWARLRCPDRDRYRELRKRWEHAYGSCTTQRIVEEARVDEPKQSLTPKQREVLCLGVELGYFDVPREADLTDLSRELGISDTAASQRIRRGLYDLVSEVCERESEYAE